MSEKEKEEILLHLKNRDFSKVNVHVEFNHINMIAVKYSLKGSNSWFELQIMPCYFYDLYQKGLE